MASERAALQALLSAVLGDVRSRGCAQPLVEAVLAADLGQQEMRHTIEAERAASAAVRQLKAELKEEKAEHEERVSALGLGLGSSRCWGLENACLMPLGVAARWAWAHREGGWAPYIHAASLPSHMLTMPPLPGACMCGHASPADALQPAGRGVTEGPAPWGEAQQRSGRQVRGWMERCMGGCMVGSGLGAMESDACSLSLC